MQAQPKPWYQSWTMWINGLVGVLTLLAFLLAAVNSGQLPLPVEIDPNWMTFLLALVNLLLRFFKTGQPLR